MHRTLRQFRVKHGQQLGGRRDGVASQSNTTADVSRQTADRSRLQRFSPFRTRATVMNGRWPTDGFHRGEVPSRRTFPESQRRHVLHGCSSHLQGGLPGQARHVPGEALMHSVSNSVDNF